MVHHADAPGRVAERDQLLAQQHQPQRIAAGTSSDDFTAGSQYCRISSPIGVPGPTRVSSSLSIALVMFLSLPVMVSLQFAADKPSAGGLVAVRLLPTAPKLGFPQFHRTGGQVVAQKTST